MQKLTARLGASAVIGSFRFTSIRLKSRPASRKLAAGLDEARQHLEEVRDRWVGARDGRMAATAELGYVDSIVDLRVAAMARDTLVLTGGDRADARYRKLFPEAPSAAMRGIATKQQDQFVAALLSRLVEEADLASLKPHAKAIERAQDAVTAARAKRDELFIAESKAAGDLAIALDDACRAYNQLYPRLQLLFADDLSLVESFFPSVRRTREPVDNDGDEPIVEPTEGGVVPPVAGPTG